MITILQIFDYLLTILWWIIIVDIILSWLIGFNVINRTNDFVRQFAYAISRIAEPFYRPFRRILPDFGGIDFAPFCVVVIIGILQRIVLPNMAASLVGPV
jgi:YggT family protein